MSGSGRPKLEIDVWSDLACPWCWVGKRRLDKAIEQLGDEPDVEARVLGKNAAAAAATAVRLVRRMRSVTHVLP